jgi:putative PIN family toxin of toxin-antitoxin system
MNQTPQPPRRSARLPASVRIVLDTDVVIAGSRSDRGASFQWLLAALERRATLLLSVPLCLEYEAVLTRREHLRAVGATAAEARRLLDALIAVAEPVEVSFLWRPSLRDPDDEMVLETAVNGRADWLLTFNVADFAGAARFGVNVGRPGAVWRETGGIRGGARG